jgi:PBP1b-binding outer membrane lipoprotein LpoB
MKHLLVAAALITLLAGCSSVYDPVVKRTMLQTSTVEVECIRATTPAPTVTTFEQWPSLFSAVCFAVIQDADGTVEGIVQGTCGTPLTMFMASPANTGLGVAAMTYGVTH